MLQPVSSPPPGLHTAASPVSPTRPSRLRGLSYLRNYTHSHLLSRDSHHHHSSAASSTNHAAPRSPNSSAAALTRSVSYTPSSSAPSTASQNSTRLNLTATSSVSPPPSPRVVLIGFDGAGGGVNRAAAATTSTISSASSAAAHGGCPPLDREAVSLAASSTSPSVGPLESTSTPTASNVSAMPPAPRPRAASSSDAAAAATTAASPGSGDAAPSIRFSAYYDPRSARPSLTFSPITRTVTDGTGAIRVGRYSERDGQAAHTPNGQSSTAPVGFKSKVVSRRHCEFWYEKGKWYIKDVKSSSGTFLNHIRLSSPSEESRPYVVNDGDIVQLGIDFKGGEENIFRCVKMRLELNRGWQNKPNPFNMAAHKNLQDLFKNTKTPKSTSSGPQDCSICLNSIAPCQSLFVAQCSHTWHFKCVRSLLMSPHYPIFVCPNCRASADLEADVEQPSEEWQQPEEEEKEEEEGEERDKMDMDQQAPHADNTSEAAGPASSDVSGAHGSDPDLMDVTVSVNGPESPHSRQRPGGLPHVASEPLPIHNSASGSGRVARLREDRSPSPSSGGEGPITPRNNAGPWVFDGSAGQQRVVNANGMRSLDTAAGMDARETSR